MHRHVATLSTMAAAVTSGACWAISWPLPGPGSGLTMIARCGVHRKERGWEGCLQLVEQRGEPRSSAGG